MFYTGSPKKHETWKTTWEFLTTDSNYKKVQNKYVKSVCDEY